MVLCLFAPYLLHHYIVIGQQLSIVDQIMSQRINQEAPNNTKARLDALLCCLVPLDLFVNDHK